MRHKVFMVLGLAVAAVLLAVVISGLLWQLSPSFRTTIRLRQSRFAALPDGATEVQHRGKLVAFTGSQASQWISFSADAKDANEFIASSPIINDRYTIPTTNGYEGQLDSLTGWRLQINTNGNRHTISIAIWDAG